MSWATVARLCPCRCAEVRLIRRFSLPHAVSRLGLHWPGVVLLALSVVAYVGLQRVGGMHPRFFHSSRPGIEGLIRYVAGDYVGAARVYRSIPESTADDSEIARLLTRSEHGLEHSDLSAAQQALSRVLALERDQYDALLLSAVLETRKGKYGAAIDRLNQALRYPKVETRHTSFLAVLDATGELERRASSDRPACLLAHYHRYLRIFDAARGDTAIAYANQAIAAGERPVDCLVTIGMVLRKQRKPGASLAALQRAVEREPRHAGALHAAAYAYEEIGDLLRARKMREAAVAAAPNDPFYASALYEALRDRIGDYATALAVATRIMKLAPHEAESAARMGEAHALLGNYDTAERYLAAAVTIDPSRARVHAARGWALQQLGRTDGAITAYRTAIAVDPDDPEAYARLGNLYWRVRRYQESTEPLLMAIGLGDPDPGRYALLCASYSELNASAEYQACLRKLLARYTGGMIALPTIPEALRNRGLPLQVR
jgi:tetratricopeptide (TPR) repeat protein